MQWHQFAILLLASPTLLEINLVGLTLPIALFAMIAVPVSTLVRCLFWTHRILKSTPARSHIPSCQFASFPGSHSCQFFFASVAAFIWIAFSSSFSWSPDRRPVVIHICIQRSHMIELHAWSKREFLQQKNWNVLFFILLFSFWCPVHKGETAVPNFLFFAYIKKWGLGGNKYIMILLACIYHAFTKKEVTVLKYNNIPLVLPGIIDVMQ